MGAANGLVDLAVRRYFNGEDNNSYLLAGSTAGSFARNNEEYLVDISQQAGLSFKFINDTKPHYDMGPGMAKFYLFGGGNKRSYYSARGATVHSAWVDESTSVMSNLLTRWWRGAPSGTHWSSSPHNADKPNHWLKTKYIDTPGEKTKLIYTDFDENKHYSETRRQDLKKLNPNTPNYKRAILNIWAGADGLVIPISPEHCTDEYYQPAGDVIMDPGTASVTAALLWVPTTYGWLIADEYYWEGG